MYRLYASPGACSRVPMIALEEAGAEFEVALIRFMNGAHKRPEYLALNPKGKVPCLITPDGPLTENPAIALYLAAQFDGLLPPAGTAMDQARITADLVFCSATLHPIVSRMRVPMFIADGAAAIASVTEKAAAAMAPMARLIDDRLSDGPWWYGGDWSIMDAYIFWVWTRIAGGDFPTEPYPNWAAHAARMTARPAVIRALARDAALQSTLEAEGLLPKLG